MIDFELASYNFIQLLATNNIRGYATLLDFDSLGVVTPTIAKFSKGDINVDAIAIQLMYKGSKLPLQDKVNCYANIKRNDGKVIKNPVQMLDEENGSIVVYMTNDCLQSVGQATLEVVVEYVDAASNEKKKIISPKISFNVYDSLAADEILEQDKITLLNDNLKALGEAMNDISQSKGAIDKFCTSLKSNNVNIIKATNTANEELKEIINVNTINSNAVTKAKELIEHTNATTNSINKGIVDLTRSVGEVNKASDTYRKIRIGKSTYPTRIGETRNIKLLGKTYNNILNFAEYSVMTPSSNNDFVEIANNDPTDLEIQTTKQIGSLDHYFLLSAGCIGTKIKPNRTYTAIASGSVGVDSIGFISSESSTGDSTLAKMIDGCCKITTNDKITGNDGVEACISLISTATRISLQNLQIIEGDLSDEEIAMFKANPLEQGINFLGMSDSIDLMANGRNILNVSKPFDNSSGQVEASLGNGRLSVVTNNVGMGQFASWVFQTSPNIQYKFTTDESTGITGSPQIGVITSSGLGYYGNGGKLDFNSNDFSTLQAYFFIALRNNISGKCFYRNTMIQEEEFYSDKYTEYEEDIASIKIKGGLNGIGEFYDEYVDGNLVKRFKKVNISSSNSIQEFILGDNTDDSFIEIVDKNKKIISDSISLGKYYENASVNNLFQNSLDTKREWCAINQNGELSIRFKKSDKIKDLNSACEYLKTLNLDMVYMLAVPVTIKCDEIIKLKSMNDVTRVVSEPIAQLFGTIEVPIDFVKVQENNKENLNKLLNPSK